MLRIRLSRVGKRKQPAYRMVVADSRSPRDGAFLKIIGHYNPLTNPPTLVVKEDQAVHWLQKGAQPSETAAKLLSRLGVMEKAGKQPFVRQAKGAPPKAKRKAAEEPAATIEPAAPPAEAEAKAAPAKPKKKAAQEAVATTEPAATPAEAEAKAPSRTPTKKAAEEPAATAEPAAAPAEPKAKAAPAKRKKKAADEPAATTEPEEAQAEPESTE